MPFQRLLTHARAIPKSVKHMHAPFESPAHVMRNAQVQSTCAMPKRGKHTHDIPQSSTHTRHPKSGTRTRAIIVIHLILRGTCTSSNFSGISAIL